MIMKEQTCGIKNFSVTGVTEGKPLALVEKLKICGVFAGVGATRLMGELIRPWRLKNGRFSSVILETSASSSTFWRRVFTWPLNRASPEPGVRVNCPWLFILFFETAEDGVLRLAIARPTMGESFVISMRADRSCCWFLELFCIVFDTVFSDSSPFPVINKRDHIKNTIWWKSRSIFWILKRRRRTCRSSSQSLWSGHSSCGWWGFHWCKLRNKILKFLMWVRREWKIFYDCRRWREDGSSSRCLWGTDWEII